MQSTTRLHDGVANAVLPEAYPVFHHPVAFHPTDRVCDTASDGRDRTIGRFLRWRKFTSTRFSLGLDDRDPSERKALEPHLLIETTPVGQGLAGQIRKAFLMGVALTGVAQEAHVTGLVDHKQVFDRVALLLAAVVVLLCLGIGWAVDRSLRAIMPKRGGVGPTFVRSAVSHAATASAVRAGSSSWWAHA
jgi:hypothetical protein